MNKKGDIKMTGRLFIGIFAGLIVLAILVVPTSKLLAGLLSDSSEQTQESMDNLNYTITHLAFGETDSILIYLEDSEMLVAFDNDPNSGSGTASIFERPSRCFNKACLVVCRDTSDSDACVNSDLISGYEFGGFILSDSPESGIVTLGNGEYISISMEWADNDLVLFAEEK
jgi:hypothetical protein